MSCGAKDSSDRVEGKILNHWFNDAELFEEDIYFVEKEDGSKTIEGYWQGEEIEAHVEKVEKMEEKDGVTFIYFETEFQDYYRIEKNGNLGVYDDKGFIEEHAKVTD
jgi:hypothetical protein